MAKKNYFYQWIVLFLLILTVHTAFAKVEAYGKTLCKQEGYQCKKIKRTDSWSGLFPKPDERELIKRVNRTNDFLKAGMVIAVPEKPLDGRYLYEFSPFPLKLKTKREKMIVIDQAQLAWAAYNDAGELLRWGPVSAGASRCFESSAGCQTPAGRYYITRKGGKDCFSRSFPQRASGKNGGGYMPYCMFFHKGYALHGSHSLPGYHASHGCVRLLMSDAKWLNSHFIAVNGAEKKGTKVIILPKTQPFSDD